MRRADGVVRRQGGIPVDAGAGLGPDGLLGGDVLGQDPAVLDRHDRALRHVSQGRVGGVAEEGDPAVDPLQDPLPVMGRRLRPESISASTAGVCRSSYGTPGSGSMSGRGATLSSCKDSPVATNLAPSTAFGPCRR